MQALQSHVPRNARGGADSAKLVDNIARYEVDIVVVQLNSRVPDTLAAHLIELRFIDPL